MSERMSPEEEKRLWVWVLFLPHILLLLWALYVNEAFDELLPSELQYREVR